MNTHPLRRGALVTATLALTGLLAACSGGSSTGTASGSSPAGSGGTSASGAGDPSKEVVLYSGRSEELVGPLLGDFTEATGVPVSVRYGDTAELAAQLLEEGDRSPAEVYLSQDAGALERLQEAGLLAALPEATLQRVPAEYRGADGTWVGTSGRARVLVYNSDAVAEADLPDSVLELTDPAWQGKVGIAPTNASFQAFVTAMRTTLGEEETRQWLADMVANDVQTYENNSAVRDAVDAGQIDVGLVNHYYWYEKASEVGEENLKVRNHFLAPGDVGSLVNVAGAAILNTGIADPNSAALVEFLLSDQAQQYFSSTTFEYPLVEGIAVAEGLPALDSLQGPDIGLGELSDLDGTQAMLTDVGLL